MTYVEMPQFYIRVNGQNKAPAQLIDMLNVQQDYPQSFSIVGVVNQNEPESQAWHFEKSIDGQGYSYNQQQVLYVGLAAVGANQYVDMEFITNLVQDCIASFGPDAVAINAPQINLPPPGPIQAQQALGNNPQPAQGPFGPLNVMPQFLPGLAPQPAGEHGALINNNMNVNENVNMGAGPQPGGGRRRRTTRRRRAVQRRRRASQRRRY